MPTNRKKVCKKKRSNTRVRGCGGVTAGELQDLAQTAGEVRVTGAASYTPQQLKAMGFVRVGTNRHLQDFLQSTLSAAGCSRPGQNRVLLKDGAGNPVPVPLAKYCGNCHRSGGGRQLLKCAGCRNVYYCNTDCQTAHWRSDHKSDCRHMKAAARQYKEALKKFSGVAMCTASFGQENRQSAGDGLP